MADEIGGVDAKGLAQEAAAAAVSSQLSEEDAPGQYLQELQGNEFEGVEVETQEHEEDFESQDEYEEELEYEAEEYEGEEEGYEAPESEFDEPEEIDEQALRISELESRLQAIGVDLGVNRDELPEQVRPAYDRLMNQAAMAAETYEQQVGRLQEAQAELQQFAQKMQESPDKILLTLAVTQPEKFQEAISTFEEMQHDDRMRDMVLRELKAEATLSAAQRAQQVQQQRAMQQKVARVTQVTHQAAKQYGVDPQVAEEVVADKIRANGGDIDISQVASLVSRLRPARPKQRVATKKKVKKQKQAPQQAVEGQGTPAQKSAVRDEASPGLTKSSTNPMMDLVKQASRRISRGVSGE